MSANGRTHERLRKLFLEQLNVEVPSVEIDLLETGVLDSLRFVELLMHLEKEFGVVVSVEDLEIDQFRSIARIAEFVLNHDSH
jgi:acyl carrier protein